CVARQCADVLVEAGGEILELGAGTGRLAACVLQALAELGTLPERYAILEVSADLSDRQRNLIGKLPRELRERVVWLDRLPAQVRGVILANEVMDALPVRRFVVRGNGAREVGAGLGDDGLRWMERSDDFPQATALVRSLAVELAQGYTSELCLRLEPWIAGVGQCLAKGSLLLFDYGL